MSNGISKETPTALTDSRLANQFEWGNIQWLISGQQNPGAKITFGFVEIAPGQKNPLHYHPNSDEVLYLIEGELDHSVNGEIFRLTAGMAIFIAQNEPHDAFNPGTTQARMVVAYSTGDRQMVALEEGRDE